MLPIQECVLYFFQDLLEDLRSRLSGDFESVTAGLVMTPAEYDAYLINKAVQVISLLHF